MSTQTPSSARSSRRWLFYAAGALALVLGSRLFDRLSGNRGAPVRAVSLTSYPGSETHVSFSPDGKRVAFSWTGPERTHAPKIFVRPVAGGTPVALTSGSAEDTSPAWSPDGKRVAFARQDGRRIRYFMVDAEGRAETLIGELGELADPHFAPLLSWLPDGRSIAAVRQIGQELTSIFEYPLDGGKLRRITPPASPPAGDWSPAVSPDGRTLAFVRRTAAGDEDLYAMPLTGGQPARLTFNDRAIFGITWAARSADLIFSSQRTDAVTLWRIGATGGNVRQVRAAAGAYFPAVDNSGQQLAYSRISRQPEVWRLDLASQSPPERFLFSERPDSQAEYSADGSEIAFVSERSGSQQIWISDSQGKRTRQITHLETGRVRSPRWSSDARQIAFDLRAVAQPGIYIVSAAGGTPRRVAPNDLRGSAPAWSHDGRSVYYRWRGRIWKIRVAGGEPIQITGMGGAANPAESSDGARLYYADQGEIVSIPTNSSGEQRAASDSIRPLRTELWSISAKGLYYIFGGPSVREFEIRFHDFASHASSRLRSIRRDDLSAPYSFSVSPDGRYALFTREGFSDGDLMLLENFE